ncbi:MAG: hypothetical protein Q9160_008698 [Pyrenula sp. 1 TL-2023]
MDGDLESKSNSEPGDIEKTDSRSALKLDPHGYPLRPQPTDDPRDPLNWNPWLKLWVLFQVSFLAFLGPFTQAMFNSAFVPFAKELHTSVVRASYQSTICICLAGAAPLLLSPVANVYGRRPIFIFVTAIGIIAHCASGAAKSYGGIFAARAFVGVGTSAGMGIGAAVVVDMYFMHERGKYMGFFVVFVTNGAHLAGLVGGFAAKDIGWRWCFWIPAIILGITWLVILFGLPETLYHRDNKTGQSLQQPNQSWIKLLTFNGVYVKRKLRLWDFTHVFYMLKYPSVLLPAFYYSISFGLGSVLFAVTGASVFNGIYDFDTAQVGMAIGLPTFIGTLLGEISAGPVSDRILYLYRKTHGGEVKPEARLQGTWPGAFFIVAGVIIEGVTLQYKTHWSGPVMGIGIGAVGLQIVSTNIYAYITDCYKPQSAEISTLLNFGRQTFSFTLGFYMIPFGEKTTFGVAWSVMAIIDAFLFLGIVALMFRGQQWREKLGAPNFDKDL